MQNIDYKQKYLKYKAKYLELKGGNFIFTQKYGFVCRTAGCPFKGKQQDSLLSCENNILVLRCSGAKSCRRAVTVNQGALGIPLNVKCHNNFVFVDPVNPVNQ